MLKNNAVITVEIILNFFLSFILSLQTKYQISQINSYILFKSTKKIIKKKGYLRL